MAMGDFTIYPAIDLRQGKVVRLVQGDPGRSTVYDDTPAITAERWKASGAGWLHVVNLDAAFGEGDSANRQALAGILRIGLKIQFGGGLRSLEDIRRALELGVARVIIGTAAVERPTLVDEALAQFGPERIAVGVDARAGRVRVRGWVKETGLTALQFARRLERQGVTTIVFTDVDRDGIGAGVNLDATRALAHESALDVIASGGVRDLDDVRGVRTAGLAGIVIGRALYEGQIDLAAALAVTRRA